MGSDTEADLLARCRRGEAAAWDELFDRHYAAAGRFVFQLGHDLSREDAEEICQEVFLSVIQNLGTFHSGSQFQTWLFRIAANKARDYRERRQAAKLGGGQAPRFAAGRRPRYRPDSRPAQPRSRGGPLADQRRASRSGPPGPRSPAQRQVQAGAQKANS